MKKILPKHMIDESTKDTFCFSIRCEECGRVWHSTQILFSKADKVPEAEGKRIIYAVIYQKEWELARNEAARQGEETFSICPICHRLVCDRCFMVCDELDMCKRCARALKAEGEMVYPNHDCDEG